MIKVTFIEVSDGIYNLLLECGFSKLKASRTKKSMDFFAGIHKKNQNESKKPSIIWLPKFASTYKLG